MQNDYVKNIEKDIKSLENEIKYHEKRKAKFQSVENEFHNTLREIRDKLKASDLIPWIGYNKQGILIVDMDRITDRTIAKRAISEITGVPGEFMEVKPRYQDSEKYGLGLTHVWMNKTIKEKSLK